MNWANNVKYEHNGTEHEVSQCERTKVRLLFEWRRCVWLSLWQKWVVQKKRRLSKWISPYKCSSKYVDSRTDSGFGTWVSFPLWTKIITLWPKCCCCLCLTFLTLFRSLSSNHFHVKANVNKNGGWPHTAVMKLYFSLILLNLLQKLQKSNPEKNQCAQREYVFGTKKYLFV